MAHAIRRAAVEPAPNNGKSMTAAQKKRDYYEVLGVERGCAQEEIKRAYRQLALEWHPDRNPAREATDRFQEIAEAYAVLSDPAKRSQYDASGHAGISERWSTEDLFRDFDFGDFMKGFGGSRGVFANLFGVRSRGGPAKPHGADVHYDLSLTLEEAAKGGERVIPVTRSDSCKTCGGNGAKPGTEPVPCAECRGSGERQEVKTEGKVKRIIITSCPRCRGHGVLIESPCPTCRGSGFEFVRHEIKAQIPAGIGDGMLLRLAGLGEAAPQGGVPGDLLVRVRIQPHPLLKREGDDLYISAAIDFASAALGIKITVLGLADERLKVTIPPGTQSGTALRLRGKGMPQLRGKARGDLYVVVEVNTPTNLTPRQRELLKEFKMEAVKKAAASA
jgi:molecular chaperone DnaJ